MTLENAPVAQTPAGTSWNVPSDAVYKPLVGKPLTDPMGLLYFLPPKLVPLSYGIILADLMGWWFSSKTWYLMPPIIP